MDKEINIDIIILAKWGKEQNTEKIEKMEKALRNIDAIVNAYDKGTLIITSEKNGYSDSGYGLDVIMAVIKNHIIDGIQSSTEKKGGFLYV